MHQNYTTEQIQLALGAHRLQGGRPGAVSRLLLDSRQLQSPEDAIFFAIQGPHHDGHDYVTALYGKGVRHFVVSRDVDLSVLPEANVWLCDNTVQCLQRLAAHHRQRFDIPIIGITGSNGKTIVKEWLFQLLHLDYRIARSPKSFNSQVGVPLSVWQLQPEHQLGIFEAGISRMGEMEKLAPVIRCNIGLFTNIGQAHKEGFPSIEEKIDQKLRLFEFADIILYCRDDERVARAIEALGKPTFSWSKAGKALLQIKAVKTSGESSLIEAEHKEGPFSFSIPFADEASVENAIHCCAVLLYLGLPVAAIQERMPLLEPVAMRLEVRAGINDCSIINDSYNLDLTALAAALAYLQRQRHHARRTLILSDILQSGEPPELLYKKVARLIKDAGVHRFFGIGKDIPLIARHLPPEVEIHFFSDTAAFLEAQQHRNFHDEAILVKGARPFSFERIARRLSRKMHQTELEVGLSALMHNVRIFQQWLRPGTKMMVMVKAAAYGSGSLEVARTLEFHQADYLAVAYADEGIELREGGIGLPILVLNPEEAVFDGILRYRLEPELYSPALLRRFGRFTRSAGASATVHLKLDTGMHRLGFDADNLDEAVHLLNENPQLEVRSIFSHLAGSEATEHDTFTLDQVARFEALYERLAAALGYRPLRHILNSSGIIRFPQYQMDMVRLGIGAYGIDAAGLVQDQLRTVLTLRARISQVKHLLPGDTVSYGRSGVIRRPSRIATVSIGYADGLPRAAGNGRFSLLVRGQRAPIIGNVCMDMCMIDITHIPQAAEGDEVVVFGTEPTAEELARALGTIPYEVFTSVSPRVRRVYVQE
ncbi:MAG: bifunctional UDP-N-acetylmuramoyl-tripeptide:D-alanyl-D-alanine ligase/alanine racemase [Lewinellaceae bacterium]|nr:bifunctional UDP-N-acetylmuramoyl-tripeptide:D-alanyl-D-alanine ligase/alanine racemase [Phaeodactylibacter sp.]MCB9348684.1 bifunctional UDP-N-acetylmuramoyl-tripeptide:D-alanyl-D-alanine ligase/alanine racemase [Lewinellaceae bacterium]